MNTDEIRGLLTGGLAPPFEIVAGGRSYPVSDPRNIFVPEATPSLAVVAIPGRGLAIVRIAEITAIHAETEAVASGRK